MTSKILLVRVQDTLRSLYHHGDVTFRSKPCLSLRNYNSSSRHSILLPHQRPFITSDHIQQQQQQQQHAASTNWQQSSNKSMNLFLSLRLMVTVTQTTTTSDTVTLPSTSTRDTSPQVESMTPKNDKKTLLVTESAIKQIQYLASMKRPNQPSSVFLRIFVDSGGCSGFQYKFEMDYDDSNNNNNSIDPIQDVVIPLSNNNNSNTTPEVLRVVIDSTSLEMIQGSTLDYTREMIKSSFVILNNPQSESACGCGSSFAIKAFKSNPAID